MDADTISDQDSIAGANDRVRLASKLTAGRSHDLGRTKRRPGGKIPPHVVLLYEAPHTSRHFDLSSAFEDQY